LTTNQTRFN